MKLDEAPVMALPRKLVEQAILGLYDQINLHLFKLVAFDFPPELRRHFQRELRSWLNKIQHMRMKPNNRCGSSKFYFDLLFEYPYGGAELENMRSMIELISYDYELQPTRAPEEMVEWLRQFHVELAERLHNGEDVLDLIPA
jgi:hypothetical protein